MIAVTHITFSEFLYLLILTTTGIALTPLNALVVGIASVLPDIDTEASTVGKILRVLSRRIERRCGHRTLTHSVLFIALLAAMLSPLLLFGHKTGSDIYICFLAGYASHPFLDTMTINGVKLFYPFSAVKCVFPLEVNQPHRYRIHTGQKLDKTLAVIFFICCIPTFFVANEGYERFIRFTQGTVASAVRDYHEYSKTHAVIAEITAHDLITKEHIAGRFTVIGALDDHTLVFRGSDGRLHTVGKEYQAGYAAEEVLCFRGDPVITSVQTVDMANRTLDGLVDHPHTLYFGTLRTLDPVHLPPVTGFVPVSGSSYTLSLSYATSADIIALGLDSLLIEQGTLIARTQTPLAQAVAASESGTPGVHNSFITRPDQACTMLVSVNDTVAIGQEIARITQSSHAAEQRLLITQQLALLEQERDKRLADLAGKIQRKSQRVTKDSIAFLSHRLLQQQGFVAPGRLDSTSHRFNQSASELRTLIASGPILRQSYALRIRKLRAGLARLGGKDAGRKVDTSIRSEAQGIVTDIRRHANGARTQITIIIKPL